MDTQIYHQNFDKETNALAQNKIGKAKIKSTSRTYKDNNYFGNDSTTTIGKRRRVYFSTTTGLYQTKNGWTRIIEIDFIVFTTGRKLFLAPCFYSKLTDSPSVSTID